MPKLATSPDDDDTTAFRDDLATTVEATMDAWVLSYTHRDRRVIVADDRFILSSLRQRHPSLKITFTLNCLAHFVAMLKDVDDAT